MNKIKVIIKRPDEAAGHMVWISDTLENMQKTVGGYIEAIMVRPGLVIVCNEEGKLQGLPTNIRIPRDIICGTMIICGENGKGDFSHVPITMKDWRDMLKEWGNE